MKKAESISIFGSSGFAGLVPLGITVFFTILMMLPIGTGASSFAFPHLPLIAVFYWTCHRPMAMPLGAAAFAGLLLDLWMNVPMGLNILMLLMVRAGALSQLKYFKGRSGIIYWIVFAAGALLNYAVAWAASSYASNQIMPPLPLLQQYVITIFAYPPTAWLLNRIRKNLL